MQVFDTKFHVLVDNLADLDCSMDFNLKNMDIAVRNRNYTPLRKSHAIWDHTVLPATRQRLPAFTPAEAGTRFSNPGRMQG